MISPNMRDLILFGDQIRIHQEHTASYGKVAFQQPVRTAANSYYDGGKEMIQVLFTSNLAALYLLCDSALTIKA